MKTRTCKRCNGTGFRSTPVLHLGVPGLCYGCDGSGVQSWVTAEAVTAERQAVCDKHVVEVEQIVADCKTAIAMDGRPQFAVRVFQRELEKRTEQLATMARVAEAAKKGEWRPAARQMQEAGA